MDIDDLHDLGTGLTIITITCDNAKKAPIVDLDDCPPIIAIGILQKAIEALEYTIPTPTIIYQGEKIAESVFLEEEDED